MQERLDHVHRRDGIRRSDGQRAHCTREPRSDQEQRGHGLQFVGRAEFQPRRRLEVWRRGGEKIGEMDFCRQLWHQWREGGVGWYRDGDHLVSILFKYYHIGVYSVHSSDLIIRNT